MKPSCSNCSRGAIIQIPIDQLSEEALQSIIEEFVTREGTDYGQSDYSLEQKVAQVRRQLQREDAILYFDTQMQTCTIIPRHALPKDSAGD